MSKTVKELADEFGVSKQAIRKQLTGNCRGNYVKTVTSNGVDLLLIEEEGYLLLKKHFKGVVKGGNRTSNVTTNQVTTDDFFRKQSEKKNKKLPAKHQKLN